MFYGLNFLLFLWGSKWNFTDDNVIESSTFLICILHFDYIYLFHCCGVLCCCSSLCMLFTLLNEQDHAFVLSNWLATPLANLSISSLGDILAYLRMSGEIDWKSLHWYCFYLVWNENLKVWSLQVHLPSSFLFPFQETE